MRKRLLVLLVLLFAGHSVLAQGASVPDEEKGPYLGVLFCPIPEALLAQLTQLPRDGGVLVTHILPDSPAAKAELRKHDILLQFNNEKIRDGDHLVRLIQSGKPGQNVRLLLYRAARELTLDVKLGLGPVLKVAKEEGSKPPGIAKPGGPAAVSVTAVPMEGNRLKLTFEYTESGRIKTITCAGDVDEIDREVTRLPPKYQSLARVAVKRLRDLDLQKANSPRQER